VLFLFSIRACVRSRISCVCLTVVTLACLGRRRGETRRRFQSQLGRGNRSCLPKGHEPGRRLRHRRLRPPRRPADLGAPARKSAPAPVRAPPSQQTRARDRRLAFVMDGQMPVVYSRACAPAGFADAGKGSLSSPFRCRQASAARDLTRMPVQALTVIAHCQMTRWVNAASEQSGCARRGKQASRIMP